MEKERFERIIESLREKPVLLDCETIEKASDAASLCAAVYPFIRDLVSRYVDKLDTQRTRYSFRNELDHLIDALERIVSIPYVSFEVQGLNNAKLATLEMIQAAVEFAVYIAEYDVQQVHVNMRAIMANFTKSFTHGD